MAPGTIPGLHHVTAIAGPPQANVDFYIGRLKQRLVKRTVNFDAPDTYHLYYGDRTGSPGTILTFRRAGAALKLGKTCLRSLQTFHTEGE